MKFRFLILFLFFISPLYSTFGQEFIQEQTLRFKHFSVTEGLSQSSVLCILQDNNGFIWFGTRDGLNKYDGYSFKTYRYDSENENSLSHNFIRSLFQDDYGNLWIGTYNGLNKYLPNSDSFQRIELQNQESIKSNLEIWSIAPEDENHIWLGTNFGLEKYNIHNGEIIHYRHNSQNSNSLSSNEIRSILKTSNGNLWICSTKNIDVFNPESNTFRTHEYFKNYFKEDNFTYLPKLYEDKDKTLWLGFNNGLAYFSNEENQFKPFKIKTGKSSISEITDEVRAIRSDFLGNIWVGTYNGLYLINNNKNEIKHYVHDENDFNSLSQNSIYNIIEDSKGDIWIGTYAGGINYYDRSFDVFKHFSSGTNNFKLNYKVVSSIIETKNDLWIGTEGGGINILNKKTNLFTYVTHDENNPNSLSANNVKSIILTQSGNFWIGTHEGGLNFLNPNKLPFKFEHFINIPEDSTSLSNDRVISLYEDYKNDIWIGTSGGGLNVINTKTKRFKRFPEITKLVGLHIFTISKSIEKDILYIGGDKGLAKINVNNYNITPIYYKQEIKESYTTNPTLFVYEDPSKNLWIGTEGSGLYYYNTTTNKSQKYGLRQGLPNEVVYTILPDESNNLWLSTNDGLSSFSLTSKLFKNFDTSDGLVGNEFNYGSCLKLQNGNLMFGGANGLNFFNPTEIVENSFIPPVLVTSILVNNEPFLAKNDNKEISLKYYQNVFSFNFVALSYSHPNKNQYAYKLEGFDENWNYVGIKKSATYTNLDSGDYLFQVKASNSDGLWNEKGDSVKVKILPAPWKTWWAYTIYSLLTISLLLIIRKYSLLRIHERNELKQERLEKQQIEELNQMKLTLFTNISHDFRTPLTLIIGPLERMISKKTGNAYIQEQFKAMHRNASVLLQLINQLLDFRKSESGKLTLKFSKNNIVPFLEEIKLSFEELAKEKEINYSFQCSQNIIELWFDKINLKKIVYNLLSNAFKYTPNNGEISIILSPIKKLNKENIAKDYLELVFKNSGKGISKKNMKLLFERFYQLDQDENTRSSGTGIGLALTKNLVELHYGSIEVKSKEDKYTKFIIYLPLGNSHLNKEEIIHENNDIVSNKPFYINKLNHSENEYLTEEFRVDHTINNSLPTLLLVEDNNEVRSFIKSIFEKDNNILEAENGVVALEIINDNKIDLVISDVMMPEMDGIKLCENIKTNISTSHIPVILLTAKTSEESKKSAYTTGADAYITKPFDANVLEIRVSNLLKYRKNLVKKFKKELILQPKEVVATSADELFLQKAIDILEKNMTNSDFTINEFIDKMGMSRSVLYRKLKALTDQSIFEFIRTIKIKRAAQLITTSELNISEIAFDLGFNDLKYFRKHFKLMFNTLPSDYRVNNSQNNNSSVIN